MLALEVSMEAQEEDQDRFFRRLFVSRLYGMYLCREALSERGVWEGRKGGSNRGGGWGEEGAGSGLTNSEERRSERFADVSEPRLVGERGYAGICPVGAAERCVEPEELCDGYADGGEGEGCAEPGEERTFYTGQG